jgi:hypothetical protein
MMPDNGVSRGDGDERCMTPREIRAAEPAARPPDPLAGCGHALARRGQARTVGMRPTLFTKGIRARRDLLQELVCGGAD